MGGVQELYLKGLSLYGQQKHAEAIELYEEALVLDPGSTEILQALAMAQMHVGRLDEALANAQKLTELSPDDPLAFTSLSMIYQRKDRIEDAEKAQARARMLSWKKELETNPNAPPPPGAAGADGMGVIQ